MATSLLNKIDIINNIVEVEKEIVERLSWKCEVFCISAINGRGCKELTYAIMKHIDNEKRNE